MKTVLIYTLSETSYSSVRYVGITSKKLKERLYRHTAEANSDKKPNHRLNWLRKIINDGRRPHIEVLDEVPFSEWQFWEKYWISQLKAWGFNLVNGTDGGEGSFGWKPSKETLKRMSEAQKGKPRPKVRESLSVSVCKLNLDGNLIFTYTSLREAERKGGVTSGDISIVCKNPNKTAGNFSWCYKKDLKERILFLRSNIVISGNTRKVNQLTKNGDFIKTWSSISEAANSLNTHTTSISAVCNKKPNRITCAGFKWDYI